MPTPLPKYCAGTDGRKSLAGKGIPGRNGAGAGALGRPPRVVVRQHGFSPRYSPARSVTRLGAQGPPADQEGGSQGQEQVHGSRLRPDAEGEYGPCDERGESQQKGEHRRENLAGVALTG